MFIEKLEKRFGQAWFDGARSVVDSRYKLSRLPLYTLAYWREMSRVIEKHSRWRLTSTWLNRYIQQPEHNALAKKVHGVLETLAWGGDLRAYGAATTMDSLATLLSDAWLDDELIDMLMTYLSTRVSQKRDLAAQLSIATLSFQHCILACYSSKNTASSVPAVLCEVKKNLSDGIHQLYFLANLDNLHWIAFWIDFRAKTVRYGEPVVSLLVNVE